jgi:hypothetical protein
MQVSSSVFRTFHRWIDRFDPENLSTLADKSHEPMTLRQSAIDAESIELIRRYRMRYTQMGKERIAELLQLDHGKDISSSSVGRVIERECLYFADTPFHWKKRLEKKSGISPTSNHIIADYEHATDLQNVAESTPEKTVQHINIEPENADDVSDALQEIVVNKKSLPWQSLKRLIIVSSVITNVAFVSLLLGSALIEHIYKPAPSDVLTQSLHAAPADQFIP